MGAAPMPMPLSLSLACARRMASSVPRTAEGRSRKIKDADIDNPFIKAMMNGELDPHPSKQGSARKVIRQSGVRQGQVSTQHKTQRVMQREKQAIRQTDKAVTAGSLMKEYLKDNPNAIGTIHSCLVRPSLCGMVFLWYHS